MKKIKFILILLMFIPCFIFAESYDKAYSIIENYMNTVTYKNTYRLFLYDNKSDFIDYNEYLITNKKGNSYLFDGTKFWTKPTKDNKYYVVSLNEELVEKENTTISAKDSEYVLPTTFVSGSGTIDNPWIFKQGYKVSISSNTYGKISLSGENKDLTNKLNLNMINTSEKLIHIYPNIGYEYISNTCGAVYTGNYLTLSNVNMNKICEVVFGIKSYKITLDNTNNDINKSNPEVIYSVKNTGYFSNESATTLINKITPPKRTGYIFNGYSKEGTIFIDSTGKVLQEKNNLFDSDGTGEIKETPIEYAINYDLDGGSFGTFHPNSATYDQEITISNPTKNGYAFDGWNISYNDNLIANNSKNTSYMNLISNAGNVVFKALWIDNVKPECKLALNSDGNIVFASKTDNIAVTSSGIGTTKNYTTQIVALANGTIYGYVKDAAGNEGTCSIEIKNTYISSYTKTTKTCSANTSNLTCSTRSYRTYRKGNQRCDSYPLYTKYTEHCAVKSFKFPHTCKKSTKYTRTAYTCKSSSNNCSRLTTKATCTNKSGCSWSTIKKTCSGTYYTYAFYDSSTYNLSVCKATTSFACNSSNVNKTYYTCSGVNSYAYSDGTSTQTSNCTETSRKSCVESNVGYVYYTCDKFAQFTGSVTTNNVASCTPVDFTCSEANKGKVRVVCTKNGSYSYGWSDVYWEFNGKIYSNQTNSDIGCNYSTRECNANNVETSRPYCEISTTNKCDSGTLSGDYCYLYGQSSCPSGWSTIYSYSLSTSTSSSPSCSTSSAVSCNSASDKGKSYVSECSPSTYSCESGYTKYNNSYCYKTN